MTHHFSLETAHVHKIRRAREKGKTGQIGGWDGEPEVSENKKEEKSTSIEAEDEDEKKEGKE